MEYQYPMGFCPEHGVFVATAFAFSPSLGSAHLQGNRQQCPNCRRLCEVISGDYTMLNGKLNVLLDPSVSPAALAAIAEIAKKAEAGEYSHERARAEVAKISPEAGRLFDIADWDPASKAKLYGAIIALVGAVTTASIAAYAHIRASQPLVIQTETQQEPQKLPGAIPTPTPRPR